VLASTLSNILNYVLNFCKGLHLVRQAVGQDWKKTGRCDFTLAKEKFLMVLGGGFVLQKNGIYREYFSRE